MLDSRIIYSMYFVSNPNICYKMKPEGLYGVNSEGFRGDDFVLEKPQNMTRIIMLGDSITYGYPVETKETFTYLLGERLNESAQENN